MAKRCEFAVVVQDESIFIGDWDKRKEAVVARRGTRGRIRYGRRDRTVAYGALAEDGIRLMR